MISIREHFLRSGKAKKSFTERDARKMAVRSRKRAYECSFCGRWHVGGKEGE